MMRRAQGTTFELESQFRNSCSSQEILLEGNESGVQKGTGTPSLSHMTGTRVQQQARRRVVSCMPCCSSIPSQSLRPFDSICLPPRCEACGIAEEAGIASPCTTYRVSLMNRSYTFNGLTELLTAADVSKSGDKLTTTTSSTGPICQRDELLREAARTALSGLEVEHLWAHPLRDINGQIDTVMRVNYDIDIDSFNKFRHLTMGQLKDLMLSSSGTEILEIGKGCTGVIVAALSKLMDVHELIYISKKLKFPTKARTCIGTRGTLSSRLQPNHQTDDLDGIKLLTLMGLSMGMGDCMLGVNPSIDTVDNIGKILRTLDSIRKEHQVPTQICVLGHIRTQLQCLQEGYPVEIMFQSLAGTDRTNVNEFNISVDLLDQAYNAMKETGPLRKEARNFMYFETGQGSSVSYGAHNGIDMATCEALAYGLARRYHPFMVNNVTGFIGPETHADNHQLIMSCLQDLFCGKVIGLPMGMAPCFTMHAGITREGQQMAAQLLASAGANYYMDVFLGCDRMLAYFDVSGHDDQTMREVHGLSPAPEFCLWAEKRGIFRRNENGELERGDAWGNPELFCKSKAELTELLTHLSRNYGFTHAGPRPTNDIALAVRANEAWSRSVVHTELDLGILRDIKYRLLFTTAPNKSAHLSDPASGATLSAESRSSLSAENNDVQIIISDGLSAEAIHHNIPVLLPLLEKILKNSALTDDPLCTRKCSVGTHIVSRYGRVKLVEDVASIVKSRVTISLIGERPGGSLESSRSMSAYLALALPNGKFKYIVIANIYPNGGIEAPQASELITKAVFSLLRT